MYPETRRPKVAMVVAQRIVQDAVRGQVRPSELLPPERWMLETYAIGRGTLREALRLLEYQGVITLKPGPKGGPVLLNPDSSSLARTLVLLMQLNGAPFRTVVEVRAALEPMISSLAAVRMSPENLDALRDTITQMERNLGDEYVFFESNKRFHDIIAWSSGNTLFGYIVDSLLGIMDGTVIGIDYPDFRRAAILKAHREILDAMVAGSARDAEERMKEHLAAYSRYAEKHYRSVLDHVIAWDIAART